jgi:hypothetical protein
MTRYLPISLLATMAACSSSGSPPTAPAFQHDLILSMALTVPPGQELHICQLATLPNTSDVEAISFSHKYSPGSLYGAQTPVGHFPLPPGFPVQGSAGSRTFMGRSKCQLALSFAFNATMRAPIRLRSSKDRTPKRVRCASSVVCITQNSPIRLTRATRSRSSALE